MYVWNQWNKRDKYFREKIFTDITGYLIITANMITFLNCTRHNMRLNIEIHIITYNMYETHFFTFHEWQIYSKIY